MNTPGILPDTWTVLLASWLRFQRFL